MACYRLNPGWMVLNILLIFASVVCVFDADAVGFAPGSQDKTIDFGFDRAGVPVNMYIWNNEFGGVGVTGSPCTTTANCADNKGSATEGRQEGLFSVYREGGDKTKSANRVDYRVSVLNPTTGGAQEVSNGKEVVWTDTNRRNIQRQVVLPGVTGPTWCVPAPITLITPDFPVTDKSSGRYRGILRIIYTPTTQSSSIK